VNWGRLWHSPKHSTGIQPLSVLLIGAVLLSCSRSATAPATAVTVGLARYALIPPPWTQPCKPPPLVFITNQRPDSVVVFQIFNAGDQDEYMLAANSTLCAYAFETFNSYLGVVEDSAYFKVTTTEFAEKATSGWTAADSTPTSLTWRAASDSALQLTVFSDVTAQGRWHIGTSFVPACSGAQP
jgi:hypothetical protein